MRFVDANHLKAEELHAARRSEPDIFGSETAVHAALSVDEMDGSEDARAEDGPHFLFGKGTLFLEARGHLGLEGVVDVLEDEDDLVEGGAEGVFGLGGEVLEVEDVLVLVGEFEGVHIEGVLVGLLRGEGVLFEEMQAARLVMLDYISDR